MPQNRSMAAELAQRIRQGDPAAEADFIERYSRGLLYLLRRMTRSFELAEDLHQEVFRVALERLRGRGIDDPEKLGEFLNGIARNLFFTELRRQARYGAETLDAFAEPVAPQGSPMHDLLAEERTQLIQKLLDDLPSERDRQLLFRFYIAEEEKETICIDLGLSSSHFTSGSSSGHASDSKIC